MIARGWRGSRRCDRFATMPDRPLTLILTGASRGIGHATVESFSAAGWRDFTVSRQPFSGHQSEKRREGAGCGRTGSTLWAPDHYTNTKQIEHNEKKMSDQP